MKMVINFKEPLGNKHLVVTEKKQEFMKYLLLRGDTVCDIFKFCKFL